MDKLRVQGALSPGNDKKNNWGNHDILCKSHMKRNFLAYNLLLGRKHFVHPWLRRLLIWLILGVLKKKKKKKKKKICVSNHTTIANVNPETTIAFKPLSQRAVFVMLYLFSTMNILRISDFHRICGKSLLEWINMYKHKKKVLNKKIFF